MEGNQEDHRINNRNKCILMIIINFLIALSIACIIKMPLTINSIIKEYNKMEITSFKKNILYKKFFDVYTEFNCLICFLDIIILIIYENNFIYIFQSFFVRMTQAFVYFNYFFFGPFLFGVVVLCMKYGNEITFIYDEKKQINVALDYINILIIFIYIFISFTIGIIGPLAYSYTYFANSIKFKRYGNYLLGKIFWKIFIISAGNITIRIDNNIIENQNNQEIQNNILHFDNDFLSDNIIFDE